MVKEIALLNEHQIRSKIHSIRGKHVMIDRDLALLYGVETRVLNQAVKRNIERFPEGFMFQLTEEESDNLISQFVTSSSGYGEIEESENKWVNGGKRNASDGSFLSADLVKLVFAVFQGINAGGSQKMGISGLGRI